MPQIVRLHSFGGPEVLRLEELDVGAPGVGEARIRVGAIGLNRVEVQYRQGQYMPGALPSTIGFEAAGVVEAVGSGVTGLAPGDTVATLTGVPMDRYGTYGEKILYPADMLVKIPQEQSLVEAAACWMQFVTAYALVHAGAVAAGDHVVITAASSSVGLAAIQIANHHGAVPIAVTRARGKVEALLAQGAAHVIVSDEQDVAAAVRAQTGGRGARIVFDAVAGPRLPALFNAVASGGMLILYGVLAGTGENHGITSAWHPATARQKRSRPTSCCAKKPRNIFRDFYV